MNVLLQEQMGLTPVKFKWISKPLWFDRLKVSVVEIKLFELFSPYEIRLYIQHCL